MKDYFYDALARAFGNIAVTMWGPVGIRIMGDEKDTVIRLIAYDSPTEKINQLDEDEKTKHVAYSKDFDISSVDFNDEYTVYQKLHDMILTMEKEVY